MRGHIRGSGTSESWFSLLYRALLLFILNRGQYTPVTCSELVLHRGLYVVLYMGEIVFLPIFLVSLFFVLFSLLYPF
jgi:hypothetical protein